MPLDPREFARLLEACRRLPATSVQEEESHVARDPILILMSTVLSLMRPWYRYALPARVHFEQGLYASMAPKTLKRFRELIDDVSRGRSDWAAAARALWNRNEWTKAQQLAELTDCFIDWQLSHATDADDMSAMRKWSDHVRQDQFVGRVKGVGPRGYEQIRWYVDGADAIKLDTHLLRFTDDLIGRKVTEEEKVQALKQVAGDLGMSATALDAKIWHYMQAASAATKKI
jgi:hypothetical protein